jgi:oligoendopeptidase F
LISLEAIKKIDKGDEKTINNAYMMLSEELRNMKPFDDFSVIREKYDALLEIKETVIDKLNKLSGQEIEAMVQNDEKAQFFLQQAFIRERHPGSEEK